MPAGTLLKKVYLVLVNWAGPIALSLFLLLMRVVWGWGFFQTGKGKLLHIERPIEFFTQLGIPAPTFNAWLVAIVETVGGLLLLAGLGARATAAALIINMTVAYLTADFESVKSLFTDKDPTKFVNATEFWFLTTAFLVFALGPGMFSVDAILKRFVFGFRDPSRGAPSATYSSSQPPG